MIGGSSEVAVFGRLWRSARGGLGQVYCYALAVHACQLRNARESLLDGDNQLLRLRRDMKGLGNMYVQVFNKKYRVT